MMKRIIALFLALILTVGLLPTVALAAEGDAGAATAPADVIDGYYDDNNEWTKGKLPQSTVPGVQAVSKTAKPTSNPNEYEVELKVVLKQTEENSGKAATVLVLDTSGSMAYCAECGAEDDCVHNYVSVPGKLSKKETYYYKYTNENGQVRFGEAYYCDGKHTARFWLKHSAGWFTTSGDSIGHNPQKDSLAGQTLYVKSATPRTSRLDAAKVAAENFLKTYSGLTFKADGTVAANQNSRNLGRYVSVVSFATGAALKQEWVDVSNANNYQTVLNKIKALKADGGTNLDAGLTYAEYLLKQTTVNDAVKNVIALTDGQPTFFIDTNEKAYKDDGLTGLDREFLTIDNTTYRVHGTGNSCNAKTFTETVASADTVKNRAKLYTVCFDTDETIDVPNNGGQISVSKYLSTKIATQPTKTGEQFAYDADNAEQLYAEFAKITQSIVSGLNTGTVKDTLPTGITSEAFGEDNVKEWKLNEKPFTKNETTNTVDGKQVTTYTYTYTYTVTIDPEKASLVEVGDENYAPLNGETTLTVKNGDQNATIHFPIPAGKVTMPSYTVTFKDGANEAVFKDETQQVEYGKPIPSHADPVRPGYNFTGWTSEPANYQPGTGTMPANNITFTAQWTEKTSVTISYVAKEGGSVNKVSESLNPDTGEATGSTATASTGYTFDGWYSDSECTEAKKVGGQATFIPTKPTTGWVDGTTFYAKFTKNTYTVTYTDGVDGAEVFADDEHNNVAYGDTIPVFTNGTPTREGYNFIGWASSVEGVTPSSAMPASNVTFTATWTEKNKATINYEVVGPAGCGSVNPANEWKYVDDLHAATGSTATANTGYRFVGWYAEEACNTLLSANAKYVPETPTEKWANATYYAKFEQIQVDVNLSPYVKKTLEVDGTLPTGFSETFKVDVTVDGQPQQQGTVTMTAAGTSNFNMPTVALTKGVHTIMVQEVVDGSTKNSNIEYDTNQKTFVLNIPTSGAAAPVQYGTTNSDGNFVAVEEPAFVTITNTYTEPKNAQVTNKEVVVTQPEDALKTAVYAFEIVSKVTVLYPTGNGTTSNTLEVPYGTDSVTLLYAITVNRGTESDKMDFADDGAEFVFAVGAEVTKDMTTGKFDVTFNTGVSTAVIYVAKTHTPLNFVGGKCTVENVISEEIKATTTVTEKDPDKCTIDFSTLIFKVLTKTGDRSFNGAEFTASVDGWKVNQYDVMSMRVIKTHFVDLQPVTLKATFPANTTFDADGKAYRGFTGDTLTVTAGRYLFLIDEINDGQTNITYDESKYWLNLGFMENAEGKVSLAGQRVRKFVDGDTYETVLALEDSEWMVVDTSISPVYFENTIDTGKDDYYPIIIPTIINKDTGMLNKTDHFAYVIGYPDGTVHPNGQITRAEVATIFFRLLKDEVRDGAFTTSNTYSDVAYGKWYNNPISTMSALGIITGYPDGTFKPNKPITRAEFAAIAARFDETQSGKSATFSDVIGHWAAKEIGIAYANEWIKGYPDGTFKPDQNITRAEAMTMINRVLERKPESPADLLTNMNKWTDNMDTSKWYYLDVQEATNSHGYTRKTFNYELWRQMLPDPDWSRYER